MAQFTPHQDAALKAVGDWLDARPGKNGTPPVFRLFGYAGTGKTTLARHIADGVDGEVKYAAFTGKAALVMRNKGCDGASTIHSLIYRARESGEEQPNFELWDDAPASKARLIVIDECSMVDADLGRDLMSFDCPLLVLGDPAQLPPIQGGGFFTNDAPDAMLTEVHRQAQDDPIVRMSMAVREGVQRAGSTLLEPMMKVDIVVPDSYAGDVIGDVASRRGKIDGMEPHSQGMQAIVAHIPLAEMFGYATGLRSSTQGRGTFNMEFDHYEEVSPEIAKRILGTN